MACYNEGIKTDYEYKLPKVLSILSAKALAILSALEYIKDHQHEQLKWVIITDSMSVQKAFQNKTLKINTNYLIYRIK